MATIYVLKLEEGKYYIGKSDNIESRIKEHKEGKGSLWTKKYKVIDLKKVIVCNDPFDEDKVVKKYMMKYGIENVRGGSYNHMKLCKIEMKILRREIFTAMNRCYKCGKNTHYANKCLVI